jgi:hypothetical protein
MAESPVLYSNAAEKRGRMRPIQQPGVGQSDPPMVTKPNAASPGSADPPLLVQLLNDEPGVRFFAAQFLHLSVPLLSAWVSPHALTRWMGWLENDRHASFEHPSPG